jgi:hypothetical protein
MLFTGPALAAETYSDTLPTGPQVSDWAMAEVYKGVALTHDTYQTI